VIDLHLHTTASDGRSTPDALVREVVAAGLTTIAVTDHDTVAGIEPVTVAAQAAGLRVVPGIEITAVLRERDVHVLGYCIDPAHEGLADFLTGQRADRRRRIAEIIDRLASLGVPIDPAAIFEADADRAGRAVGRPRVAQALVEAGHVRDIKDAFARYLADGQPAFVPRRGAAPADVVAMIQQAGGLGIIAHPGILQQDDLVRELARGGLDGVEVFHPEHDEAAVDRYRRLAADFDLVISGGSDYHGPGSGRSDALGRVSLPADHFDRLLARAGARDLS
jgi:predicted metal-dependent phosphoesterase TrpH